jgi:transposase
VSVVRREVLLLRKLGVFERHNRNILLMVEVRKARSIYTCCGAVSTGSDPNSNISAVWLGPNVALQGKMSAHLFTIVPMMAGL